MCRASTDRHVRPAVGEAEALGHLPPRLWKELGAADCKMLITNAGLASVLIVAAKTAPDVGRRGISTFLVEAPAHDQPGGPGRPGRQM